MQTHGLVNIDIASAFNWRFAEFVFRRDFPVATSMDKARQFGFLESVDSADMYTALFEELRTMRILPPK